MGDYDLRQVPVISRLCFIYCTILASETDNRIPFDCNFLSDRMGMKVTEPVISVLIERGLLLASGARRVLAIEEKCSSLLSSSEIPLQISGPKSNGHADEFEIFWEAYPRKVGKKKARVAWRSAKDKPDVADIIKVIDHAKKTEQWTKENGQFIPHPSTWLNEGRWSDDHTILPSIIKPPPFPPKTDPIARNQWRQAYGDPRTFGYE